MDAAAQQLADQSAKFHAFEWLRGLALAGNKHARVMLSEGGVLDAAREAGRNDILFGPCPELKGMVPLVLYLSNDAEADEVIALFAEGHPKLKTRKLP